MADNDTDVSKPYIGLGRNQRRQIKTAQELRKKPEYQGTALDDYYAGIFGGDTGGSVFDPERAKRVQANDIGQITGIGLDVFDPLKAGGAALLGLGLGGRIRSVGKSAAHAGASEGDSLARAMLQNKWGTQGAAAAAGDEGGNVLSNLRDIATRWKGEDTAAAVGTPVQLPGRGRTVPRSSAGLAPLREAGEGDIASSLQTTFKERDLPRPVVEQALSNRARLRAEKPALPKPAEEMTERDWQRWGNRYGVNMTQTPMKSLGISDLSSKREIMVPGGLEGTFTIPDLFALKGRNFDPNALPQDVHNALMAKFMRSYERPGGMDAVDKFNALNFALLSPNAPLTQNEFLMQRLRVRTEDEMRRMAQQGYAPTKAQEKGTGAAWRGGFGVKGTADLGNQAVLANTVLNNPDLFKINPGESMKDVTRRVMNAVPGLGTKTASLGVPWLDLSRADTSAVDLHMIRNNAARLAADPQLGPEFTARVGQLVGQPGVDLPTLMEWGQIDEKFGERLGKALIDVTAAPSGAKYRLATGEVNPRINPAIAPEKMGGFEPEQSIEFGPFYSKIVDYVDESRRAPRATSGPIPQSKEGWNRAQGWGMDPNAPELPLFPEQWRLWDRYRARVEPHEMMHPDFRKLPRMSWPEMKQSLDQHKAAGYMRSVEGENIPENVPVMQEKPWGQLYYGKATVPGMGLAAGVGLGAAAAGQDEDFQAKVNEWMKRVGIGAQQ